MALLDRLRRRPRWEDPDPKVRADGVREIPAAEQDRLAQIASADPDAHVRRAAVRRLSAADVLARIASADEDAGVREKAASALVTLALGTEEATAVAAGAALSDARHLMSVALSASLPAVRADAVCRLRDARALVRVARTAGDPALRLQALSLVAEPSALAEVATRGEHKDAAVAAVDRIEDLEALRTVAGAARNKAAARRARERLAALAPAAAAPVASPDVGDGQEEGVEEAASEDTKAGENVTAGEDAAASRGTFVAEASTAGGDILPAAGRATDEPLMAKTDTAAEAEAAETEAQSLPQDSIGSDAGLAGSAKSSDAGVDSQADEVASGEEPPVEPAAPAPPSLAPRLRRDRKERVAQAEVLCARLAALVAADPFLLRDADVALREARLAHDDLAALPPKLARHLRESRAALFARAQEAREAEEWSRWGNAAVQEELCRRMEALAAETDLERSARDLRTLDARWAEVKTAPRGEAETLRHRYQAARGPVKEKLDAYFAAKSAREAENLRLKQELAARAEALADSTDWLKASDELKALQARWKEIGAAPRRAADAVWKRFRGACDRFFSRRQEDLKKRKQEWSAHMARKQALCERAEALATSTDWEPAAAEIRRLQAEWKTVGPVRRDRSEAIWQRFRKACDAFFERYKHRDEAERQARRAEREAVCLEIETLVAGAGTDAAPANLAEEIQRLVAKARQGPPVAPADEEALAARAAAARDRAVAAWPEAFRGTDLDPGAGRARREKLCARVEALLAQSEPPVSALSGEDLARRLKEALATNTMGGRGEVEARRRAEVDEVKAAQAAWKRLSPLPSEIGESLEARFRAACDRFFRERQPAPAGRGR